VKVFFDIGKMGAGGGNAFLPEAEVGEKGTEDAGCAGIILTKTNCRVRSSGYPKIFRRRL